VFTPTLTLPPTPVKPDGKFEIRDPLAYPNPNVHIDNSGMRIKFILTRDAEKVTFKLFTVAFRFVRQVEFSAGQAQGSLAAGDNEVAVYGEVFKGLAQGTYYYIMTAQDGNGRRANSVLKPVIIIR
jgi:hypothetical protein